MDGKVAIVTGSARGTGEQTARLFAEQGARVAVADVQEDRGRAVADDLGDSGLFVKLDVSSEESWSAAMDTVTGQWSRLDALVNNAGVLHMASVEDTGVADFERLVRVNQLGPFLGMRAAVAPMRDTGGGAIVNISSVDGLTAKNGVVAYASTKWAVRGMTRVAAIELGKYGIRVNAVCPEAGGPEMRAPYVPEGIDPATTLAFMHRLLPHQKQRDPMELVRDIAKMVLFLASDDSLSCTGADYPVDAGWTAGKYDRFSPGA
jgi:3alpha(or 20beta)-hydroxysteroid dehydrogenase